MPPLLKAAMVSALVGTISYYWVVVKLVKAGVRVKYFATPFDSGRMFRTYFELAPSRGWPFWPVYIYWAAVGVTFALAIVAVPYAYGNLR